VSMTSKFDRWNRVRPLFRYRADDVLGC